MLEDIGGSAVRIRKYRDLITTYNRVDCSGISGNNEYRHSAKKKVQIFLLKISRISKEIM
jgi:hypothetical protein